MILVSREENYVAEVEGQHDVQLVHRVPIAGWGEEDGEPYVIHPFDPSCPLVPAKQVDGYIRVVPFVMRHVQDCTYRKDPTAGH